MTEVTEIYRAGSGAPSTGRPRLDLDGLAERWTPQIAANRKRSGRARAAALVLPLAMFFIAPWTEANNYVAGLFVILALIALCMGLLAYSTVMQQRALRAVKDLYAVPPEELPPLQIFQMRTVPQFDAWLAVHDRTPADREPQRLERSADGSQVIVPLNDAVARHGVPPPPVAPLGKSAAIAVVVTWLATVLGGFALIVLTGNPWVMAGWFAVIVVEGLAFAALIRSRRKATLDRTSGSA